MSEYPPFSGDVMCPKCGGPVEEYEWQPKTRRYLVAAGDGKYVANQTGDEEWMLRGCHSCGYCWPEQLPEAARSDHG